MSAPVLESTPLLAVREARDRLAKSVLRTPLVRLQPWDGSPEIYLKLENLQPTGSFKVRGAANALLSIGSIRLAKGVWTASAGNMAQALAWLAHLQGIPCTVIAPNDAPPVKIAAIQRLGGRVIQIPFRDYQLAQRNHYYPDMEGVLVHPFADPHVIAGNGTIGLEILEDLPEVEAVLIPYGGGGLSCGIASALRSLKPGIRIFACESGNAAPLAASLAAGTPVDVSYTPSFISGMGAPFVFPEMWGLASRLLDGSLVVEVSEVAEAIRILAQRQHLIAEGAGAIALAAALAGKAGVKKVVCVVTGGNIDMEVLTKILSGKQP